METLSDFEKSKLRVRILEGKNFRQGTRFIDSTLLFSVRLLEKSEGFLVTNGVESIKSHARKSDNNRIVTWDETMILSPIKCPDTVLHVRVFEHHILKDIFIGECFFSLNGLFSNSENSRNVGIDGDQEIIDALMESPRLETVERKIENKEKISQKQDIGKSLFSPIKPDGLISNIVFSVLPSVLYNNDIMKTENNEENIPMSGNDSDNLNSGNGTDSSEINNSEKKNANENENEIENDDEKYDMLNTNEKKKKEKKVFSWQSMTNHKSEKILFSEIILNDLSSYGKIIEFEKKNNSDNDRKKNEINSDFSNKKEIDLRINENLKILIDEASPVGNEKEEKEEKEDILLWYKCHGRYKDDENDAEKGEIHLSFLLE